MIEQIDIEGVFLAKLLAVTGSPPRYTWVEMGIDPITGDAEEPDTARRGSYARELNDYSVDVAATPLVQMRVRGGACGDVIFEFDGSGLRTPASTLTVRDYIYPAGTYTHTVTSVGTITVVEHLVVTGPTNPSVGGLVVQNMGGGEARIAITDACPAIDHGGVSNIAQNIGGDKGFDGFLVAGSGSSAAQPDLGNLAAPYQSWMVELDKAYGLGIPEVAVFGDPVGNNFKGYLHYTFDWTIDNEPNSMTSGGNVGEGACGIGLTGPFSLNPSGRVNFTLVGDYGVNGGPNVGKGVILSGAQWNTSSGAFQTYGSVKYMIVNNAGTVLTGKGGTDPIGNVFYGGILTTLGTGPLAPGGGGTGLTSCTAGDIIYASATNVWALRNIGSAGDLLNVSGGFPVWSSKAALGIGTVTSITLTTDALGILVNGGTSATITTSGTFALTGVLNETHGGTNQTTYATGDMLYASAADTLSKLAIGTTEQILMVNLSGIPQWVGFPTVTLVDYTLTRFIDSATIDWTIDAAPTPDTISAAVITQMSITADASGLKLDGDAASPGNNKVYGTDGAGVKGWQAGGGGSGTVTSVDVSGGTTGLTFSGGPITTSGTITMAGTLDVDNGGTGNTTFTAYSVICAGTTATGAFQNVSGLGTTGQVLTSNGAGALPTWQAAGGLTSPVGVADGGTGRTSHTAYMPICGGTTTTAAQQSMGTGTTDFYCRNAGSSAVPTWLPGGFGPLVTATDGATVTFDLALANKQIVTLGGNRTLALSNDGNNGQVFLLILRQDGTGTRTVTWFSGILWDQGTTPTLTTTINKYDVFGFIKIGSGSYLGMILGQNM